MDQNNIGFKYLKKFPKIIDVKWKNGYLLDLK